jgi:hypothetical protein
MQNLDCTKEVKLSLEVADAEGNALSSDGLSNVTFTAESMNGDFGEVTNDAEKGWVFNPGTNGATGKVTATADWTDPEDQEVISLKGEEEVTLEEGGPASLKISMAPVEV